MDRQRDKKPHAFWAVYAPALNAYRAGLRAARESHKSTTLGAEWRRRSPPPALALLLLALALPRWLRGARCYSTASEATAAARRARFDNQSTNREAGKELNTHGATIGCWRCRRSMLTGFRVDLSLLLSTVYLVTVSEPDRMAG